MLALSSPKPTTAVDADEDEFLRLAVCFEHLGRFLYRDSLEHPTMLQSLHFLTRIFLESVPACVQCPQLFLSLAILFLLTTPKTTNMSASYLNKLPAEAPFAVC